MIHSLEQIFFENLDNEREIIKEGAISDIVKKKLTDLFKSREQKSASMLLPWMSKLKKLGIKSIMGVEINQAIKALEYLGLIKLSKHLNILVRRHLAKDRKVKVLGNR
jgi:hypothetical protein